MNVCKECTYLGLLKELVSYMDEIVVEFEFFRSGNSNLLHQNEVVSFVTTF